MADVRMRLWALVVEQTLGAPVSVEHAGAATITSAGVDAAGITVTLATSPRECVHASNRLRPAARHRHRADEQRPEGAVLQHPVVHQVTGMVIAQLRVNAAVALIRLRAYAYSHDRRLRDVAAAVVGRRLLFRSDEGE